MLECFRLLILRYAGGRARSRVDHGVFKKMKRDLAPFNQQEYLICQWYDYLIVSPTGRRLAIWTGTKVHSQRLTFNCTDDRL